MLFSQDTNIFSNNDVQDCLELQSEIFFGDFIQYHKGIRYISAKLCSATFLASEFRASLSMKIRYYINDDLAKTLVVDLAIVVFADIDVVVDYALQSYTIIFIYLSLSTAYNNLTQDCIENEHCSDSLQLPRFIGTETLRLRHHGTVYGKRIRRNRFLPNYFVHLGM